MIRAAIMCFLFSFLNTAQAESSNCDWTQISNLNLVSPATTNLKNPIQVQFALNNRILLARFEVQAKVLNVKEHLEENQYPYQYDVVEVFVSAAGGLPYYEFELTPLNQTFQVKINDPKQPFIDNVNMGLHTNVQKTKTGWVGEMQIPLDRLGWKGDVKDIVGNAFAIQGKSPSRSFWSLFMPAMPKPRFHQPRYFRPLLSCP